ncbi:MAG: efflux RND transporter permease subunit [Cyanobacteria bacterium J06614_10]
MSFNTSSWSIRRPVPTLVLFLVLILMGITSFFQLGIDANPNIALPIITISTTYPGAGPQELETQFTQKVEDAVAGLGDVTEIYSGISDGSAYTNVRFDLSADTDKSMDAVRDAMDRIRQDLAPYAETMTIQQMRYDDGAVLTYAIRSETQSIGELSDFVDRTIQPALMAVKGVEEVRRVGGVDREIRVDLDPLQLEAYSISAAQVNQQIAAFNENLPGGRSQVSGQEQTIRALGRFPGITAGLQALQNLSIVLPSGRSVPLETLATVSDGFAEVRQAATVDNQPVVSFSIFRSNGSLLVDVEDGVTKAIASLQSTLPPKTDLQLVFTRATDIREAYKASIEALLLGSILAVIVVGCFLRNWRTTLITAAALPLSIIPTFIVIRALGYSLNSMTLLALTLAVGNLVDDAIVEIENVERHIAMGKTPTRAALDSSAEVGLAVITTTATVVAVFIPVAFMGGIPGQFFQPFGVTVAVSTLFSTLVARFITPLLASRLLLPAASPNTSAIQPALQTSNGSAPVAQNTPQKLTAYERLLRTALRHRLVTMMLAIAIFIASLSLIPHIPTGLSGASNTDLSHLAVELPSGTRFQQTQQATQQLTTQLKTHPAVASIYVSQNVADAEYVIQLKPKSERDFSRQAFEQQVRELLLSYPDLRFTFDSQGLGNSEKALTIILKGADPTLLNQTAADLAQQMKALPGLVEVSTSNGLTKPELLIIPNAQQATDLGVSLREIATTAALATLGDTDTNLATLDAGDRQIPIRTRLAPEFRSDLTALANLSVMGSQQLVPLSAVADISLGGGPADIRRFDRTRQVTIAANLQNISLGQALDSVYNLPTLKQLPAGITEQTAGDADILQDVFQRFTFALGTAIIMIYAVLVLLYNSFIYPLAVMSSLPLGIGGTFIALMLTQKPLDLYSLIGIVLLMGLVTKNAILLVDCALQAQERGLSLKQAVIESGITRMRPILMTSISTVSGMVPIALELGAGGEVRSPMAIAVIGGFSTATLLTLIVVPVCFTYIAGLQQRLAALPNWLNRVFTHRISASSRFLPSSNQPVPVYAAASLSPIKPNHSQRTPQSSFLMTQTKAIVDTPSPVPPFSSSSSQPVDSTERPFPKPQPHPQSQLPNAAECTYKIACIENDFDTLCRIHQYLDNTAFSIVSVADPAIALTDLTTHRPDIILMTTSMPGLNSFQICDRLRKNPTFRHVPIILLSNQATWWHSLKAKWYGATACLPKPLERTTLLIKLFFLTI